jgi:hypothetical protein
MKGRLHIKKRLIIQRRLSVGKAPISKDSRITLYVLESVIGESFEEARDFAMDLRK